MAFIHSNASGLGRARVFHLVSGFGVPEMLAERHTCQNGNYRYYNFPLLIQCTLYTHTALRYEIEIWTITIHNAQKNVINKSHNAQSKYPNEGGTTYNRKIKIINLAKCEILLYYVCLGKGSDQRFVYRGIDT